MIQSTHAMLAFIIKTPELAIDDNEATLLAKSAANVAQHYDVVAMSEKSMAWIGFAQTLALVYGPRVVAVRMRTAETRAAKREGQARQQAATPTGPKATDDGTAPRSVDLGSFIAGGHAQ